MEQFEGIRRDSRDRAMSIRELARRHRVHRRTVRQALADAVPPPRKVPERSAPAIGPYVELVRRLADGGSGRAAEAAAYRAAGLAAAGRGARRPGRRSRRCAHLVARLRSRSALTAVR